MAHLERRAQHDVLAGRMISVAQHILVVVFGLLPVFFVPLVAAPFGYSKVLFVLVGVLVALILYGAAFLRSGTVRVQLSWAPLVLWMVAFTAFVSALLSGDFRDALIGEAFGVHTTLFLALMALVASTWMLIGVSKLAIMRLFVLLSISTLVLALFHLSRLFFGAEFLSFGLFGGDATLSPLGGWNDLGIFFGLTVILSLVALEQLALTRAGQALFGFVVVAALVMLAVINFFAVWVVLALISLVLLVYGITKGRFADGAEGEQKPVTSGMSIGASIVVFAVATTFIIGGSALGGAITSASGISYLEVRPSAQATLDVVRQVYQTDALFGMGPNRFEDAWRLFKDKSINESIFWNTDFSSGFGYIPTFFATTGIIGGIVWILFLAAFFITGMRMLIRTVVHDRMWYFIGTVSFVGGMYLWILSIVYVSGPVLLLVAALCTGLVGASYSVLMRGPVREVDGYRSRRVGVVLIVLFLACVIGSVSALYFTGRHYAGVYTFNGSLIEASTGGSLDTVEEKTVAAYSLTGNDAYARRLAEYQLARLQSLLSVEEPTQAQQDAFVGALDNGINASQAAINLDSTDPRNWSVLGNIYATLITSKVEGAYERSVESFTKAHEFDPQNPLYLLTLAQVTYASGKESEAREYVDKALTLKQNYGDAIFFIAQMDITAGNTKSAIEATRAVTVLEPQNPVRFFQLGLLLFSDSAYASAATAFERAIVLNPLYANARYYLALVYDSLGRPNEARDQLAIILKSNPDNQLVISLLSKLESGESLVDQASDLGSVDDATAVSESGSAVTITATPDTTLVTPVNTPVAEEETSSR